jgi:hypothetical protein
VILVIVWLVPAEGTEGLILEEGSLDINHMLRY